MVKPKPAEKLKTLRHQIAKIVGPSRRRKWIEENPPKIQRALRVLTECSKALVRATEESAFLQKLCRIIVKTGGYRLAWVGYAKQNKKRSVEPVAYAGCEKSDLETLEIKWSDTKRGNGSAGTAIRTGKPSIARNIGKDPRFDFWRDDALKRGYASSIALPIANEGQTICALNIYAAEPDAFHSEEVDLLRQLADDLGFGILALRTRAERERAEKALKTSEHKFRALFDSMNDAVFIFDLEGRVLEANPAACERLGYSREELLKMTRMDFVTPEYAAKMPEDIEKVRRKGHAIFESAHVTADKTIIPTELSTRVIEYGGEPAILSIARDITERKRAETSTRLTHRFLEIISRHRAKTPMLEELVAEIRSFTGCSAVGIRILDSEGNIPYEAYTGFSDSFYKNESPLSIKFDKCMCINVIKGETTPKLPFYTDGGSFYMNGTTKFLSTVSEKEKGQTRNMCNAFGYESVALIPIKLGKRVFSLIHVADPREEMVSLEKVKTLEWVASELGPAILRLQAEEALQESEERYRMLVDNAFDAIYMLKNRRFTYVNPRFEEMMGYSLEEVTSPDFDYNILLSEEHQELVQKRYNARRRGDTIPAQYEMKIRNKAGKLVDVETSTASFRKSGELTSLGIMRNITERKQAEVQLRERIKELQALYNLSKITEREGITLDKLYQELTDTLPISWYHSEITCVRIVMGDSVFHSKNFAESKWVQSAPIKVNKTVVGRIDVIYVEEMPEQDEGPFLKEERQLIDAIAERLGHITERKQAEEALQESESKYRTILKTAMDGYWIVDVKGQLLEVNDAYCEMIGYSREELLTMSISDLEAVETMSETEKHIKKVAVEGDARFESKHVRKDGKTIQVEISGQYRDIEDRQFIVFVHDITERKRAEEEIQQSYEIQTVLNCLLHLSLEGYSLEEILERVIDHIISVPWLAVESMGSIFLVEDDPELLVLKAQRGLSEQCLTRCARVPFGRCVCGRVAASGEIEFLDRVDERHEIQYEGISQHSHYCVPIKSEGKVLGVINLYVEEGHRHDEREEEFLLAVADLLAGIIEHKRTGNVLMEERNLLRTLINTLPETSIYVKDRQGRFVIVNQECARREGMKTPEELIGKTDFDLYSPERAADFHSSEQAILQSGEPEIDHEKRDIDKMTGEERWSLSSKVLFRDNEGNIAGLVGIIRDITERKRAEEALHHREEQLRQSQKMEAVGQLAGGIAHDFNNLLTVITGYSQLALKTLDEDHSLHEGMIQICKASASAASLTRQLLAFSRKQILQPTVLNINDIVHHMEKMLRRIMGTDIDLIIKAGKKLGKVRADLGQIEQVIMNLVVNARDAMPSGGTLRIETRNVKLEEEFVNSHEGCKPGPHVMLTASDTGTGMNEEVKEKIFEPFFTTKELGHGTGLGLATMYGIIKQSDGYVTVLSEPGQGTSFQVYLPRTLDEIEPTGPETVVSTSYVGSETILLVEDEDMVRELTRDVLLDYGYTVLEAHNAGEAFLIAEKLQGNIDLLLTDIMMPLMSGGELAERFITSTPDMKILLTSGHVNESNKHYKLMEQGAQFLPKPYMPDVLLKKVREVLDS